MSEAGRNGGMINRVVAGRYDILETVGEGPLLAAYRSRDRALNRIVTLKAPVNAFADRDDIRDALRDGLAQVVALTHPAIVRTFDVGVDEAGDTPLLFFAEEYVRGIDLKERIRRAAPFQLTAATDTAIALAEALEYTHWRGITHGDLRPQNVLIGPEGAIKLTGYGVAAAQRLVLDDPARLRRVAACLPPPQANAASPVAADLYALGVLLYETLTGDLPYAGETTAQIAERYALAPGASPRLVNAGVPRALDGIVQKLLGKRSSDLYPTATALLVDLRAVRDALRFGRSLAWSPLDRIVEPPVRGVLSDPPLAPLPGDEGTVVAPLAPPSVMPITPVRRRIALTQPTDPAPETVVVAPVAAPVVTDALPPAAEKSPYLNSATGRVAGDDLPTAPVAPPAPVVPVAAPAPLSPPKVAAAVVAAPPTPTTPTGGLASEKEVPVWQAPEKEVPVPRTNNTNNSDGGSGSRWLASLNWFLAVLVIAGIAAMGYMTFNFLKPASEVVVPNLVGRTQTDAKTMALDKKFDLATVDTQFRDNEPADVIYQQQPAPGRHIREGKAISIWVSRGPRMVDIPDVRSMSFEKARAVIEKNNLRVGDYTFEYDPLEAKGNVLRQAPVAAENRPRGTRIDLVLSKGEEPAPTPMPEYSPPPLPTPDPPAPPLDVSDRKRKPTPDPDASPSPDNSDRLRTFDIQYPVPADGAAHRIRLDVTDRDGTRTVFDETRKPGDKLRQRVEAKGQSIHIRLFDNDTLRSELSK